MAKIKHWLLIALILFNIIHSTLTYFVPQNEKSWSLNIRDMTTKIPPPNSEEIKLVNILKSLTGKLRKEGILESPATTPPAEVTNQLNSILKSLTEKLTYENIIQRPKIEYESEEIPLELESFETNSKTSENKNSKIQKRPLIIGLNKIALTQLVLENEKNKKKSARTDDEKPIDKYRSIFDFHEDHQIKDPFISRMEGSDTDIPIDLHNFPLFFNSSGSSNPKVIKFAVIKIMPMEEMKYVDPSPYIEPDPPNFKDQTLRLNDYSLKSNDDGLRLNDYSLKSVDDSPRSTSDTPVIHMDTMVEDYYKIFNTNSKHNKQGSIPKSIRIVDSELPIDIELANRRKNVKGNTPGFGISMKDLNEAIKKLKSNGNRKRIMVSGLGK